MNRQRGMSSLALVLLILLLGSLLLNGLNQQLATHIRRVSAESRSLRQYADAQSAMAWAQRRTWNAEQTMQCQQHASKPWRACLRIIEGQRVVLTAGSGEQRLWRSGEIVNNAVVLFPHGWSDFCPRKERELCQLP